MTMGLVDQDRLVDGGGAIVVNLFASCSPLGKDATASRTAVARQEVPDEH